MNNHYTTLIIDDEPPARERLSRLLLEFPETFKLLGTAQNASEAVEKIKKQQPDLIFLDIEMPGLNGFEVLERLDQIPLVIFCTAYDQYSLKAFETNSLDYLLKPVRKERLEKTVIKLRNVSQNLSKTTIRELLNQFNGEQKQTELTALTVKEGDKIRFIKLNEVLYFESSDKYVSVYTKKQKHLCEHSLTQLEAKLSSDFIRIQRGLIVNKNHIQEVYKYFNSRYALVLNDTNKTRLISGRTFKEHLDQWLSI